MATKFKGFVSRKMIDEVNAKFNTLCELTTETKELMEEINSRIDSAIAIAEEQNQNAHNIIDGIDATEKPE